MSADQDLVSLYREFVPEQFSPSAYYDVDGDCIEFFGSPENFRAERLDKWVTVYIGEETGAIVGSVLKGVSRLLQTYPGLDIEIHDGKVCLSHILRAPAWSMGDEVAKRKYKLLIDMARGQEVEIPQAA